MKIEKYQAQHFAGGTDYSLRGMIWLYDTDGKCVANVRFHKTADAVPPHDTKAASGFIAGHYPPEEFPAVLDLLRNEKPLYLQFSEANELAYFSTLREPIGEGEL